MLEASTALRLADTAVLATPQENGMRPALDEFLTHILELLYRTADAIDGKLRPPIAAAFTDRSVVTYRVLHRTEYRYESRVSSSYGELYVLPRDAPGQVCRSSEVRIEPAPHDYRERTDFFNNRVAYFAVLEPHIRLTVTAESMVDVTRPGSLPLPVDQLWEVIRDRLRLDPADDVAEARGFVLGSPKVVLSAAVAAYAAQSFPPERPLTDALSELDLAHPRRLRLRARFDDGAHHAR